MIDTDYLPPSEHLNISALTRFFRNTTNSYKYILFLSLLDILKRNQFHISSPISFEDIKIEMLANAWYPHTFFKLSFGAQDQLVNKLNSLSLEIREPILKFTDTDKKLLRETISNQDLSENNQTPLMKYVPFRLIRPFFEKELQKEQDYKVNQRIAALAEQNFHTTKPLYKFDEQQESIIFHPQWVDYLHTNYAIVRAWVSWEWLTYMQKCNPNVPAVSNKLFPPQKRESLSNQTKYWKIILENSHLKCIYSNHLLNKNSFSLDHYLPWSFVGHDLLWNLIPTVPSVNSSKSNNIPSHEEYFQKFVNLQHLGLTISNRIMSDNQWDKYIEPYLADLKIDKSNLLNLMVLRKAYQATLIPLISLAVNQGFMADWLYLPPLES